MQSSTSESPDRRRFDYASMTPAAMRREVDESIDAADRLILGVVAADGPRTFDNTLAPLVEAVRHISHADGVSAAIGYVHPDEGIREAGAEAEERTERWRTGVARRGDLAAAVRAYADTDDARELAGARLRTLDLWLRDFRRGGHELSPEDQAEYGRLRDRVTELGVAFGRNLAEWSDPLELGPDDLDGLSDAFVAQLPAGREPGSRLVPSSAAVVYPFIEQSTRRDLRETALSIYMSRCAEINRPLLEEIVSTRRQLAESWAPTPGASSPTRHACRAAGRRSCRSSTG